MCWRWGFRYGERKNPYVESTGMTLRSENLWTTNDLLCKAQLWGNRSKGSNREKPGPQEKEA